MSSMSMEMQEGAGGRGDGRAHMLLEDERLVVKQRPRGACMEYCCGCEYENEYRIFDSAGSRRFPRSRVQIPLSPSEYLAV
jgi:hypothetical protein